MLPASYLSADRPLGTRRIHLGHLLSKKGGPGEYDPISLTSKPCFRLISVLDTLFLWWENAEMLDLNDLRVFEGSCSSAAACSPADQTVRLVSLMPDTRFCCL